MNGLETLVVDARSLQAFLDSPMHAPVGASVVQVEVRETCLVLGSTQAADTVDEEAAAAAGVTVVRRRSGGGAVLVAPGALSWLEVLVARDDPRWDSDVGRAFGWVGEAIAAVLVRAGHRNVAVHPGPLVRSRWSTVACFAGLGFGEVTVAGRKVAGISQRRTREGARFQCAIVHRWDPAALPALLRLGERDRARMVEHLRTEVAGIEDMEPATLATELAREVMAGP